MSGQPGGPTGPAVAFGPEEAGDYLNKINFKSLVEYLSAEVIVNRPEDPLLFIRNVLDNRIAERHEGTFAPNQVDLYLKKVYTEVEEHADEYGTLPPRAIKGVTANAAEEIERLVMKIKGWEAVFNGMQQVMTKLDPTDLIESLIQVTVQHLEADRATVFLHDQDTRELFPYMPPEGSNTPLVGDEGVAYAVIKSGGDLINIKDPYSDPRFDQGNDHKTGYRTTSVLAAPIKDLQGAILGVILVMNKANSSFHIYDQEFLTAFCNLVAIALQNSRDFEDLRVSDERSSTALDLIKCLQESLGMNLLLTMISQAEWCTVYLVDSKDDELVGQQGDTQVRQSIGLGIAGGVAASGDMVNIADTSKDCRYDPDQDKHSQQQQEEEEEDGQQSPWVTRNLLCMPMKLDEVVVGVLELVNKIDGVFGTEDEDFLKSFLAIVTPILRTSQMQQNSVAAPSQSRRTSRDSATSNSSRRPSNASPAEE